MKIYSMTATFGKLEHQTLTLKPGLNIIEAPNEWGKSTWCAFILAMLYGIDTKAKTTKTALAEKERYAPWSGAPMAGRMDICWNGRDITIERRTKGRLIFGDFRAYETGSGLDVPELTALNCGIELLGVERSVFTRAGFLKMTDLPVTQDDALRRRLNSLVTTGDEDGAGEQLTQKLKELKNKCRYNRSGLLPQAEAQRDQLEQQLRSLQELNAQAERLQNRQQELDEQIKQLRNHKVALSYAQAQEDLRHIRQAETARDSAKLRVEQLDADCQSLPSEEETERARANLQRLHSNSMALQMEQQMLPSAPQQPEIPARYLGMNGNQAKDMVNTDIATLDAAEKQLRSAKTMKIIGILLLCAILLVAAMLLPIPNTLQIVLTAIGAALVVIGIVLLVIGSKKSKAAEKTSQTISTKYAPLKPQQWQGDAQAFANAQEAYERLLQEYFATVNELNGRTESLTAQIQAFTKGESIGACLEKWEQIGASWRALGEARRDFQRAESQLATLHSITKEVSAPQEPDKLTYTLSETDALLNSAAFEQKQNQLRLGQYQGQAGALGNESALRQQLKQVKNRISQLEDTCFALELAQKALSAATGELQRRFAPRISKRAQELFAQLTNGRYQRIMLTEDLSMDAATEQEDTLRSAQWRSDGTVDQLYLALRLAVAEELTPEAPLVLDDAMVRFDDKRLETALHILKQFAQNKQVILFTCQGRETKLQGECE